MALEFPATVQVVPLPIPEAVIVPVSGPAGPQGEPGPPGDTAGALAYGPVSVTNQALVQINHGLIFQPAGIICIDNNGVVTDFGAIAYPMSGTCEITFGFPFSGTIFLS